MQTVNLYAIPYVVVARNGRVTDQKVRDFLGDNIRAAESNARTIIEGANPGRKVKLQRGWYAGKKVTIQ